MFFTHKQNDELLYEIDINIKAYSKITEKDKQRLIKNSSPKLQIQFGDSYAYLAINRFVGFINMINNLDSNGLSEKLAVKIINGDYEVGAENIPLPLLNKIQDISKKITFERNSCIEVSPKKFVQDQIKVALIENTLDYFEKYTVKTIDRLITETTGFIANKLYYLAAQTNLRIYECIEKSQALAERVDGLLKNNCQLEINTELLNRYKTRKKLLEIKLDEIRDIFIKVMPNIKSVDDKELPDLYGHIYHILYFDAEELLRSKKTEAFRKALKVLFGASKELLNANINEVLEINPNIESNYLNFIATQPLFDLLELSGYAKIYSELYGQEDLWTACLEEWERNKDNAPDPDKYTNLWKFVYVLKNTMYPVHERDMLRHNWEIKLRNQFIKEGVIEENIRYGYYGSPLPKHKSKLIVYLANHDLSFERGSDIFMIYLGWWDDNSLEKIDKNLIEIKNIIEKDENE